MKRIVITDKYLIEVNSFDGWLNFCIVEIVDDTETYMGEIAVHDNLESALEEIKRRMIFDLMPDKTTLSQYIDLQIEVGDIIKNKFIGEAKYCTPNSIRVPNIPTTIISDDVTFTDNSKNTFIKNIGVFDNRKK